MYVKTSYDQEYLTRTGRRSLVTPPVPAQVVPDDAPIQMTRAEWQHAAQQALHDLGMTFDELADEARRRDFRSARAKRLWVIIGGDPEP
jgi:hypothetical protein